MNETTYVDSVLIRFGELGLKNNNRGFFEKQLKENIEDQLSSLGSPTVQRVQGALRVVPARGTNLDELLERLGKVPGIAWYAPTREVERDPEAIARAALEWTTSLPDTASTFAVSTQRSDKTLDRNSQEFNVEVGATIDRETNLTVDLDDPDWEIHAHLLNDGAHVFFDRQRREGFRGLPVEASGDALCLLSGGIDSPVAAIKAFKRGTRLDFLHYYPYPSAREALDQKMGELLRRLVRYGTRGKLYMAPYHVYDLHAPSVTERDEVLLFRRHIVRVARKLAERNGHKALVTGESLGQVASQTLENIGTIADASDLPILRPLIGLDKQEIVDTAKEYGTFEQSVRDYQDCCTIQSTRVRTTSSTDRFRTLEEKFNVRDLDERLLDALEVYDYGADGSLQPRHDESVPVRNPEPAGESNSPTDTTTR